MRREYSYTHRKIFQSGIVKSNPVGKPKGYVDVDSKSSALRREFGLRKIMSVKEAMEFMASHGLSTKKYAERCIQLLFHSGEIERVARGVYKLKEAA